MKKGDLETYFEQFRKNIIGIDQEFDSPYGKKRIVYNDWIAGGRLYMPIERKICETFGPFVANTHTETSETGTRMTLSYHRAHTLIKEHVNAGPNDVIITAGSGMTSVVCKLQRILGLKGPEKLVNKKSIPKKKRPIVFLTHMEHHSNHTSWYETIADVVILKPTKDLLVDLNSLRKMLVKYKDRKFKIGTFTACSNVTGIMTPYYEIRQREEELVTLAFKGLKEIPSIRILADNVEERLGVISFYHPDIHYNLIVKLLNDRFGIQVRGGCVCAGTYGHYLLEVSYNKSREISEKILHGDLSEKPGWVRWSLHPTTRNEEVKDFIEALKLIVQHIEEWKKEYLYNSKTNEFVHRNYRGEKLDEIKEWFFLE